MRRYRTRVYLLFLFLLLTVGVVGYLVLAAQRNQENQIAGLETAYEHLELLDAVLMATVNAETGERGFVITGDEEFLQPYHRATVQAERLLTELRATVPENSPFSARMNAIDTAVDEILVQTDRVIAVRRAEGQENAIELVRSQVVKQEMDRLRQLVREWKAIELEDLAAASREVDRAGGMTRAAIIAGFILSGIFLLLSLGLISRETRHREKTLMELTASRDELASSVDQQKLLLQGRERLRFFTGALQTCRSLDEAKQVLAVELPDIAGLPGGALAIQNPSRVYLEVVQTWGAADSPSVPVFEPADCFSLRRGRPVWRNDARRDVCCPHFKKADLPPTVCFPLTAHNQVLGALILWGEELPGFGREHRDLLVSVAETFSVVLSNLQLDETLRFQAVMDPLTGLYNRRHMEASLDREVARAKRNRESLAVLMVDVDHFKEYNDSCGHDAADAALQALGELLTEGTRGEDVACRYGGEEFLVVLPGIGLDQAVARAEQLRSQVEQMHPRFRRETLPGITISVGVALYPGNGVAPESLIHAADQALYLAKKRGRNRIEVAGKETSNPGPGNDGEASGGTAAGKAG